MSTEIKKEIQLEIAHVLFVDIVGYSKLLINEQSEQIQKLKEIVRGTEQVRLAEAEGKLLRLPTGDGGALVFRNSPEAPVLCAVEIANALKDHPELRVRMGVHSGPVNEVTDLNAQANIAGAGINITQRVMDCGDAGHILLSKHVAEDLEQYPRWQPYLHDLGECEVKHGVRTGIVSLYDDQIGNPQLPKKLRVLQKHRARSRLTAIATALLLFAGIAAAFVIVSKRSAKSMLTAPEKSIAVLPFENLSENKENAFFADGVQDEILTDLAKVADLKVISRTSVIGYRDTAGRNPLKIGQELGVAHLLEGSVQRAGNRVRVNAQLIDARTDGHLWAQTYDRDLADVFAIQSEIAKAIADQLQAKLSPAEKTAIEQPPTSDIAAFDLYTRAKTLLVTGLYSSQGKKQWLEAVELLNQAVARDPSFFDAYCQLVLGHDHLYITNLDHTPARLASAEQALRSAVRLRPDSGEAHLASAGHLLRKLEYDPARAELALAQRTLVNSPRIFEWAGYIDRRQGRWEEAVRNLNRALELDPRNLFILEHIAITYDCLRRYPAELATLDRAIEIFAQDTDLKISRAWVDVDWHANLGPIRAALHAVVASDPTATPSVAQDEFSVALLERNFAQAARALAATPPAASFGGGGAVMLNRAFIEGKLAGLQGDAAAAQAAFGTARAQQEQVVRAQPDYAPALCALALIDARLGRKEDALSEGRRALELMPVDRDALDGSGIVSCFAEACAWLGEKNLAYEYLTRSARLPNGVTYGGLRLNPNWDSLRGDPRFEQIVASLTPKAGPKQ
jgi:TolB-like protein/Tfp pilus assembly protein PilF